jgi:hypothetical protein
MNPVHGLVRLVMAVIHGILPMPAAQREEQDDDGRDHSAYRQRRIRLHMLEKRGRGGYR